MFETLSDGRVDSRDRPTTFASRRDLDGPPGPFDEGGLLPMDASNVQAFIGPVRTMMTTILGFSEMLDDPDLTLTDDTRREYATIVVQSSVLLSEHLQRRIAEPPKRAA